MAVTITADELAALCNGGSEWSEAEKTRMLALATAVYAAEGVKKEAPDASQTNTRLESRRSSLNRETPSGSWI